MEVMDHERSESGIFKSVSKESGFTNSTLDFRNGGRALRARGRTFDLETDLNRTALAFGSPDSTFADFAFRNETAIRSCACCSHRCRAAPANVSLAFRTSVSQSANSGSCQSETGDMVAARR